MPHTAPLTASLWGPAEAPRPAFDSEIVRRVAERAQGDADRRRREREALDAARAEWER